MIEVKRGRHLLAEPGAGIVGDSHVLLFQHDLKLRLHDVVGQHQAGHAIGLELHQGRKVLARCALEVARIVGGGERVLLAAQVGHGA